MQARGESEIGHCVEYTSKKVAERNRASLRQVHTYRRSISGQKGLDLGRVTTLLLPFYTERSVVRSGANQSDLKQRLRAEQQKLSNELVNPSLGLLAGQAMNQSHFGGDGTLCLIIETCLSLVFNVQAKQTSATTLMQSAGPPLLRAPSLSGHGLPVDQVPATGGAVKPVSFRKVSTLLGTAHVRKAR
jgi:hypothetical protein